MSTKDNRIYAEVERHSHLSTEVRVNEYNHSTAMMRSFEELTKIFTISCFLIAQLYIFLFKILNIHILLSVSIFFGCSFLLIYKTRHFWNIKNLTSAIPHNLVGGEIDDWLAFQERLFVKNRIINRVFLCLALILLININFINYSTQEILRIGLIVSLNILLYYCIIMIVYKNIHLVINTTLTSFGSALFEVTYIQLFVWIIFKMIGIDIPVRILFLYITLKLITKTIRMANSNIGDLNIVEIFALKCAPPDKVYHFFNDLKKIKKYSQKVTKLKQTKDYDKLEEVENKLKEIKNKHKTQIKIGGMLAAFVYGILWASFEPIIQEKFTSFFRIVTDGALKYFQGLF